MLQATVSIDAGAPRGILATLSAPVLNEVAARALNDTAKNAQFEAAQQLTPMMGLPSKTIQGGARLHAGERLHAGGRSPGARQPLTSLADLFT